MDAVARHTLYHGWLLLGSELKLLVLILTAVLALEADFTQTKTVEVMNEPQVSEGHMVYRAPDYLQWRYTSPQQLVWEIDGNTSNVNPQIQRLLRMIMASIAGGNTQDEKLQRETKRLFRTVDIRMDASGEVAERVELTEKNGDKTVIEFTHVVKK